MTTTPQPKDYQRIRELLGRAKKALIVAHVSPDGDTLGSAMGLAWALRDRGLEVRVSCADPVPPELSFIPGSEEITPRSWTDEDLVFCVDASSPERLGKVLSPVAIPVPVVNIDHHVTNPAYGDLNLVENKASTAELVLELILQLGLRLDRQSATCLLIGLVSDTRCFRTSNTTRDALQAACVLIDAGAPLAEVTDALYNHRPLPMLKLWGAILTRLEQVDGVLIAPVTQDLLSQLGIEMRSSRDLVNFLSATDGTRVAVVLRETEDGLIDVSMRSKPGVDVSGVAAHFGGGGHAQAAGCLLPGPLGEARKRLLGALSAVLWQTAVR